MRVVVMGGGGLIGQGLVAELERRGHEAVAASRRTGVDVTTGAAVAEALAHAHAVVDVTNTSRLGDEEALRFFTASADTLLAAGRGAGVGHYLVLSVVGADRLPASGYLRAKVAQEQRVAAGGVPHTVVRATQFFEFVPTIADVATRAGEVRLPPVLFQPVAAADVVVALADATEAAPHRGVLEVGGPERFRMDELAARALRGRGDPRPVVADPQATYFGAPLDDTSLLPGPAAVLGPTRYDVWLAT